MQAHQFYEMMLIRHGFMVVGMSYSGKSTIIKAVARALCLLREQGLQIGAVVVKYIHPKAVYITQLYGHFDAVSHEWQDGILAKNFRCA
jgi:dynein heavy chain, axonemal